MKMNHFFIILFLIFGYTYPSVAQDYSSLGKSIHSSKLYSSKLKVKKGITPFGTRPDSGLLYERGTNTLKGGTFTFIYISTMEKMKANTPTKTIPKSLLGQSLYKQPDKKQESLLGQSLYKKPIKEQDESSKLPATEKEKEDESSQYYSNIFYKKGDVEEKKVNPFLRK